MVSRRNFIAGAGALLLPRLPEKRADLKPSSALSPIRFSEVARRARLDFGLQNNPTARKHMIETMPGGVAAFDYNNNGRMDIFFTNGASIRSLEKDSARTVNRLYCSGGRMTSSD